MRGRAHTPDVEGRSQIQAEDVTAFLEDVVSSPAHLVGASDGSVIGLIVAIQRPTLLRKLVVIGANFHHEGMMPGSMWSETSSDDEAWAAPRGRYEEISPDGLEHWRILFAKLQRVARGADSARP